MLNQSTAFMIFLKHAPAGDTLDTKPPFFESITLRGLGFQGEHQIPKSIKTTVMTGGF